MIREGSSRRSTLQNYIEEIRYFCIPTDREADSVHEILEEAESGSRKVMLMSGR